MSNNETFRPSLQFMKELLEIADKCIEHDAAVAKFTIGPLDGLAIEVSIEFSYKEV